MSKSEVDVEVLRQREESKRVARALLKRWGDNPVQFARDVFPGLHLWKRQVEILNACAKHKRVSVRSGHKIGKSTCLAILALWFVVTKPRARVAMTSAVASQVRRILWRELKRWYGKAKYPLGGKLNELPDSGLSFEDQREVFGFSTKTKERAAGISGDNLLFIVDEASGVPEEIFETLEGNSAGGGWIVMCSNPTRQSGTFFNSHHKDRTHWHTISVSSEEAAEVTPQIKGLATREWVEKKKAQWGFDSPLYKVRVRGEFAGQASNAIIGLDAVSAALLRHEDARDEHHNDQNEPMASTALSLNRTENGSLVGGLDAARMGDDKSEICFVRGDFEIARYTLRKGDGPEVAAEAWSRAMALRIGNESVQINVDVIGVGSSVYDALVRMDDVLAVPVNVGESPDMGNEKTYSNLRAQLWFGLAEWLKTGAILSDDEREAELVTPTYSFVERGQIIVEPKKEIKKRLDRSPDKAEALMLAVYNPPIAPDDDGEVLFFERDR